MKSRGTNECVSDRKESEGDTCFQNQPSVKEGQRRGDGKNLVLGVIFESHGQRRQRKDLVHQSIEIQIFPLP